MKQVKSIQIYLNNVSSEYGYIKPEQLVFDYSNTISHRKSYVAMSTTSTTNDEIDWAKLAKDIEESIAKFEAEGNSSGIITASTPSRSLEQSEPCNHKMIEYRGILEQYKFCENCDWKEPRT